MLNYQKVQKVLLIILEGLVYLSFLMPFVFLNGSIFPFIVGKILFFQAMAQLMAAVYLLLLVINFKQFKPKKNFLLYWLYFYAATLFLSAVFGIDFERSFFSNFERMTGVFVVFHFITYSIIVSVVFNTWPKIKRAIQVLLGASLIQVAVVAAQYAKPGVFLYANKGGRVWGTLGNSIYIGSYFLFHIFFAAYLAVKEKKQVWQIIYLSIALLEAYIIVHSKSSRGATLALILSAVFIIFAYAFFAKNKKIQRTALFVVIGAVAAVSAIFLFQNTRLVKNISLSQKIIAVPAALKEGTGRTRLIAWEIAWKAFKERPMLGWGSENFYYIFNKYYNPESLRYSYYETWFDRSHSVIFDTLSSGGAAGVISYFGLFAVGGYLLIAAWRKGFVDKHTLIFFTAIFSTYLIQILFVFDHPASYFLIYFSFGLLLSLLSAKSEEMEPKYSFTNSSFIAIAGAVTVGFLILFFSTSVRTYKAATGIIEAESIYVQNYKMGLQSYKTILLMKTPFIDDMRSTMAKRVASVNPAQLGSLPDYKDALLFARGELLKQTNKKGTDVYDYIILGQLDTLLAQYDSIYLKSAEDFFAKARELSPKRQQIYYTWAKTKIMAGDYKGAEMLLKDALEFEPLVPDSYWYLALLYEQIGQSELAWPFVMEAISRHYTWKSPAEINFALSLGEKLKKDSDLAGVYNLAIGAEPRAELYAGLGNVYMRLGKKDEAYGAFMQAEKLNPDIFKKK